MFWLIMAVVSTALMQSAHAESSATYAEGKAQFGMTAYLECLAKRNTNNYLPWGVDLHPA